MKVCLASSQAIFWTVPHRLDVFSKNTGGCLIVGDSFDPIMVASCSNSELHDMDNDGAVDLVYSAGTAERDYFEVHWNKMGKRRGGTPGFELSAERVNLPIKVRGLSLNRTERIVDDNPRTLTSYGLIDMNADGRPDLVMADPDILKAKTDSSVDLELNSNSEPFWQVYFNFGEAFSDIPWEWRVVESDELLPNYISSMLYSKFIDMNGDSSLDFLHAPTAMGDSLCDPTGANHGNIESLAIASGCYYYGSGGQLTRSESFPTDCCAQLKLYQNTTTGFLPNVGWTHRNLVNLELGFRLSASHYTDRLSNPWALCLVSQFCN